MFSRKATFLTSALEAALSVVIGMGLLLVPITILWLVENDPNLDWTFGFKTAADIWLLAQGAHVVVPAGTIAGIATQKFVIAILPLGYTAILIATAFRLGRRLAATSNIWPGWLGGGLVYGGLSFLVTNLAQAQVAFVVEWQGLMIPTALFMSVVVLASLFAKPIDLGVGELEQAPERLAANAWLEQRLQNQTWWFRAVSGPALRAGTAVVFTLVAVSALGISILLALNWIEVIRLYEGLQLTILGGFVVTFAQLAFLPNLVIFGATWLTGVGFSIGTGSLVSPLGSSLGPLPSFPVLAALPVGELNAGMIWLMVPLLAAFAATLSVRKYADEIRFEFASAFNAALALGLAIGVVAGIELGLLSWWASGAIGPGRLEQFGANPWLVALVTFIETAVVATIAGFYSAKPEAPDDEVIRRVSQVK
ncbi:MAG: DUF6350 family protein [Micrococcales bacterium]